MAPKDSNESHLEKTRSAEENNYQASVERLGDTFSLAEDFINAYEAIGRLLRETADPPEHLYTISVFFLAAQYQLRRALLDCLRARLTDSVQATRRAIELAAFAAKVHRHPHLAEVWQEASESEEAYERYRKKFSKDLFPKADDTLAELGWRYDHASKQFHGSSYSVARRLSVWTEDASLEFSFRNFEIADDDLAEPARSFLWIVDTHLLILRVFEVAFTEQMREIEAAWAVRRNALVAKLEAHKQKWQPCLAQTFSEKAQ